MLFSFLVQMTYDKYGHIYIELIFRSMHTIILGGTHQLDDYNRKVDAADTKFIYEGCIKMNASINRAKIVKEMVGLRPGRVQVRLEHDSFITSEP